MRYGNRSVCWATTVVLLLALTAFGAAAVSQSDIIRTKAKVAAGERLSTADLSLVETINATTTSRIDIDRARALAKKSLIGDNDHRRPPRNPLDDYFQFAATYDWVDISADGQPTNVWGDDANGGPFAIGFTFPFYGDAYTTFRVCTNGWLSFTSSSTVYWHNVHIPDGIEPNNVIYAWWDDLYLDGTAQWIKYRHDTAPTERLVVTWRCRRLGGSVTFDFQMILYPTGNIVMQYQSLPELTTNDIVGVENQDGTQALELCYNGAGSWCPAAESAIMIGQPDGVPQPPTNLTANYNAPNVVLQWTDPDHDTNGNLLTPDSLLIFLGGMAPQQQIGHVAHGIQAFTHANAPSGNLFYYVRAKHDTLTGGPAIASVIVGSPTYSEDFEQTDGLWVADNGWIWGAPTNPQAPTPHGGTNMWGVGMTANYQGNQCDHLDLTLDLPVVSAGATVEFWAWWSTYEWAAYDGCNFKVSVDGGNTWEVVTPQGGYGNTIPTWNTCLPGEQGWSLVSNGWQYMILPIGNYVGQTPIFRFTFGSYLSGYPGFFFDDLMIWGLQPVVGTTVSGTITLDGGSGDVTQVMVRSNGLNNPNTHPNSSGDYTLANVQTGNRILSASLTGYQPTTRAAAVPPGGLTGQDMTLRRNAPPIPTGLTASVNNATGAVTLNWDASPDPLVDQYKAYRKLRDDTTYVLVATYNTNSGADQLPAAGIYNYVITAVDVDVVPPALESGRSARAEVLYGALPPQMLVANGNFDDHIRLTWFAPGVPPEVEAFYDNGVNQVDGIGWWGGSPTFGWLVAHYQGNGPITVTRVKTYISGFAAIGSPIQIGVFADNGTGLPTFTPLGVIDDTEEAPLDTFKEWTLNPAITFDDGSFFVGMRQMTTNSICVGGDNTTPFINNTFFYSYDATTWSTYEPGLLTIPMQRCIVIGDMGGGLAAEHELAPSPVRSAVSAAFPPTSSVVAKSAWRGAVSNVRASNKLEAARAELAATPTTERIPSHATARRLAERVTMQTATGPRAPHLEALAATNRHSHTLDDVIRYRIYRDTVLHDSVAATQTFYNDMVAEAITYTYRVTAYYDNDEESGSTNNASAMAAMAPGAPIGMTLTPLGITRMRISWTDPTANADGTPCVDLASCRVYRDGELLGTVAQGVQQYIDTPPHNDSLYAWTVTGIDEIPNEGPAATGIGGILGPWIQPAFEWIDISQIGTNTGLSFDDETLGPFDLGFDFSYYDNTYSTINVSSNGFASFTSMSTIYWETAIPSTEEPNCALYPFWDDMYLPLGGSVMYYSDAVNHRFIISWLDVPHIGTGGPYTYQIVISNDGSVTYNYLSIAAPNNSCLVGVENCDGTQAYQVCLDGVGAFLPHDSSSVAFWRNPMVFAPVTGHVALDGGAGTVTSVSVTSNGARGRTVHPAANGNFTFDSVQVGNRRLVADLTGYVPDTLRITVDTTGYTGADITLRRVAPPTPTNFTGTVNTIGRKDSLHWDVSPDVLVDGYRVYRKLVDSLNWNLRLTVTPRSQNWVRDTLEADGVYQYYLTAIDNDVTNPPIESPRTPIISNPFGHLPPQMMSVNGNFDNKYHLAWIAPGLPPEVEAFYDNGVNEVQGIGWWGGQPTFGWLVAHYQGSGMVTVTRVKTYLTSSATIGSSIQIGVFADDGTGIPTFTPLGVIDDTEESPLDTFKEWTLQPPVTFDDGSFFVGMRQMTTNSICVGGDNTTPFINNTFFYSYDATAWTTYESSGLLTIPMQRCFVIGDMGGGLAGEYELSPSPLSPAAPATGFSALRSNTVKALETPVTAKTMALKSGKIKPQHSTHPTLGLARNAALAPWDMARRLRESLAPHAPIILAAGSSTRHSRTLDDVIRYLIYRDNAAVDSVAGTITAYDHVMGSNHENEPHSFYVKARWDDNGLSPASNTVSNAVYNMAPGAPTNMALTPVGQTQMRLTWGDPTLNADGLPCVDLAGLRIYRDGNLITATPIAPGVQQYTDTPPDPMTIYTWTVRGIDEVPNEGPAATGIGSVVSPWHTVEYNWVDITGIGSPAAQGDDANSGPIDIGFSFPYYGNTYTTVNVCSNGWINFTDDGSVIYWEPCPLDNTEPLNAILAFGADLYPISGECRYYADVANQRFIVSWDNCPHFPGSPTPYNFQVILDANGGVTLQYGEMVDNMGIVGVKNADGSDIWSLWCQGTGPFTPGGNNAVQFWGGPRQALEGVVRHFGGTNPVLTNAQVWVTGGPDTVLTDNNGQYTLPVDPGTYTVNFRHATHCDSVRTGIVVEPNVNTTLNVSLRAPNATLSVSSLTFVVHRNTTEPQTFTISNVGGNCPLHFQVLDSVTWLSSIPATGDVNPGQTTTVTVTAAPGQMQPGEYTTTMRVVCNAPGSPFLIQVDMNVLTVEELSGALPTEFALHQNYPNPFNPATLLPFDVPQESQVNIVIYNVMGQEVARPVSGKYSAGRYQVSFSAGDLPSGIYLVKMTAGKFHSLGKMMLLK